MADRESFHLNVALPCILKSLNAIRGEDQINIKRSAFQFNKILPALNLRGLAFRDGEAKFRQCRNDRLPVFARLFWEQIDILCGVRKTQKNRSGFSNKEISTAMTCKGVANFFRLSVLKPCHTQANPANSLRTTGDSLPLTQTTDTKRRPILVYMS